MWRWMRYYRCVAGWYMGWDPCSNTDPAARPLLLSRSGAVAPPRRRHAHRATRPVWSCRAVAIRAEGAVPRLKCRHRAGCCHLPGGSSAMRDHDDNRFRPWTGRVGDRHDLQGRGCPDVVPCGPRFGLRYSAFLGLFPCTRRLGPRLAHSYRQNKFRCATTMHASF